MRQQKSVSQIISLDEQSPRNDEFKQPVSSRKIANNIIKSCNESIYNSRSVLLSITEAKELEAARMIVLEENL